MAVAIYVDCTAASGYKLLTVLDFWEMTGIFLVFQLENKLSLGILCIVPLSNYGRAFFCHVVITTD